MKKYVSTLLLVATFFISHIVSAQKDKGFNFPPDFGKTEAIILVREGTKDKITEAMTEALEKEYKGPVEQELGQSKKKLEDKNKYRWVFFVTEEVQPARYIGRDRFPATTNYRFGLIDRSTGVAYQTEFISGAYGKGAKYYAKHLEEFRKQNAGQ